MSRSLVGKRHCGFSLIELMITVAVVLILAAISVPRLLYVVSDLSLRMEASDLSGLLQSTRIQAVRKNTYYSTLPGVLPSGTQAYYIDLPKNGAYLNGDPEVPINPEVTAHQGIGSGAPNEGIFIASLNFTVSGGGNPITFDPRGLPCSPAPPACPETPGQGFVVFMSKPATMGNSPWVAVVVNASGHVQIWSCDANGNWTLRD